MTSRNYCVTIHDMSWTNQGIDHEKIKYYIIAAEKGNETGKEHYQCYFETKQSHRIPGFKKIIGCESAHCESRRGSREQAIDYCKKDGKFTEFGQIENEQGKRSDLLDVAESIAEGKPLRDVAIENPVQYMKFHRGIEKLHALQNSIVPEKIDIVLRPWQTDICKMLEADPVKRRIIWVWSEASETGKSTFQDKLLELYGIDKVLYGDWSWTDLLYAYENHRIVIFNLARADVIHETHLRVLEHISDGGVKLSKKFESKQKLVRAHIIVFANVPAPRNKLPKRFVEICLDHENPKWTSVDTVTVPVDLNVVRHVNQSIAGARDV